MNSIKLIASDMDHTLLTELGEMPIDLDNCILELEKLGIVFVIASGRPLYTLEHLFSKMKNSMGFISDNGGAIKYKGEIIFKSLLKTSLYQEMVHFVEQNAVAGGVPIICGLDSAYIDEKSKTHGKFLSKFYSNITFVADIYNVNVDANKFTIYFPNQDSKRNYKQIFKPQYGNDLSVTVGDTIWIDIMNKQIDKGAAMRFLGEHLKISPYQMMAFGDTYNDIEMLQAVKHSYIVKNAHPDMKQYANFIADSNDNFGVIKIIKEVIRSLKTGGCK